MKTLIIGSTGGIGKGLAQRLLSTSHTDDTFVLQGKSLEKLNSTFPQENVIKIAQEFNSSLEINTQLLQHAQTCDTLCVCYGPFLQKGLHEMTKQDWLNVSSLDFALPGFFVSTALPHMIKNKFGNILLFGGTRTDSICAFKTNAAYGSAKIAIASLVKSVEKNYSQYGIRCNAILPGFVKTEYVSLEQEKHYEALLNGKKMISVKEISEFAENILSDTSKNGQLCRYDLDWSR